MWKARGLATRKLLFRRQLCTSNTNSSLESLRAEYQQRLDEVRSLSICIARRFIDNDFFRFQVRQKSMILSKNLQRMQSFRQWRKQNRLKYIAYGGLVGVSALTCGIGIYLYRRPETIERIVVDLSLYTFSKALNFDSRKSLYFDLPEPSIMPASGFEAIAIAALSSSSSDDEENTKNPVEVWAKLVLDMSKRLDKSFLVQAKKEMCGKLVQETLEFEDVEKRLSILAELLPPSIERDIILQEQLEMEMKQNGGWLKSELLEGTTIQGDDVETYDLSTKLLIHAISFFPGPINGLYEMIQGKISCDSFASRIVSESGDKGLARKETLGAAMSTWCSSAKRENVTSNHSQIRL